MTGQWCIDSSDLDALIVVLGTAGLRFLTVIAFAIKEVRRG